MRVKLLDNILMEVKDGQAEYEDGRLFLKGYWFDAPVKHTLEAGVVGLGSEDFSRQECVWLFEQVEKYRAEVEKLKAAQERGVRSKIIQKMSEGGEI
jgi:hypothetical protein